MNIFITGGSGFVGRALSLRLAQAGHKIIVLTRQDLPGSALNLITYYKGDPARPGLWQEELAKADAVINLAGYNIFARWTNSVKQAIRQSRLNITELISQTLAAHPKPGRVLLSASAVGYYGFESSEELTEDSGPGSDFLASVCLDWEQAANLASAAGVRVVTARFGIILGPGGGMLQPLLPLFKWGLGSVMGSGRQWLSWIHLQDLCAALLFCLSNDKIKGPVNCTAPNPVTNREFSLALGRVLNRPVLWPAPAWVVKAVLGEMSQVVLGGQRVLPAVLESQGFAFTYPAIDSALSNIVQKNA